MDPHAPADRGAGAAAGGGPAEAPAAPGAGEGITGEFLRVPLSSLGIETVTDFTLYLRLRNTRRYVLYRKANLLFTEAHRDKLRENGIKDIYISTDDRGRYFRYLEDRLDEIIASQACTEQETSRLVYDCSTQLMSEVIEKPWLKENVKRARGLVCSTVRHLLRGTNHLRAMIRIMSSDYYTYTHCVNVCVYGVSLGQRVGLSAPELHELGLGLLLHDLGKSQIPRTILNKPARLTAEEWSLMRTHPSRGVEILRSHDFVPPAALQVVAQHHEKCSGAGYPHGLASADIHLFAKIASLADVFDALTTHRPYRVALPSFQALQVMQREMHDDFHPVLFEEMIRLLGSRERTMRIPARPMLRRMARAARAA